MNLSLSQKGLIVVAVPLLFHLAFVVLVVRFERERASAERWAGHTKQVIARAHEVRAQVYEVVMAVRGFVVARDPAFAARFETARAAVSGPFDALEELVADNPAQVARARAARAAAGAVVEWNVDVARAVAGGAADAAAARVRSGGGEARLAAFGREIDALLDEEERIDQQRTAAREQARGELRGLFLVGGVAAVGSTLFAAYVFRRGISRRFAALEGHARRLAAGERLPAPPAGRDEIARLGLTFHRMADELIRAGDEARDLYDHAPCGYHSVDPDGVLLTMNRTELGWLGCDPRDTLGRKRFVDFVAPASRDAYAATFARVRTHGAAADVELDLVRQDGTTFPVLLNSSAVRDADGQYLRSRTTLTDLTERKRAEAATRWLADVTRHVPVGLTTYQLDPAPDDGRPVLRIRSVNEYAVRELAVPPGAIGRRMDEVFPGVSADVLRRYAAVAADGRPDDLGELEYGDSRVSVRWWSVHAFPLPGRSVGIAFRDVSERRRAEAEVRRLNDELEGRVRERTAELEAANRELSQKNAENEMFVYSVSHDLRSPLVNLQGFSKELEKACRGLSELFADEALPAAARGRGNEILAGRVAKSVGFIQSAVMRLSGIIDALLRLSRAGRVDYHLETVNVGQVVERVVSAAQATIADRGAAVTVGPLPPVRGDRTALEQVFGNLIHNALTYLDPARPGAIEVGARPDADGGRTYFVRDNGLGIAEAHRHKVFQAFQRVHPGVGSGEGLGLAIVARVVERHRGRVWVESRPGEGSTFYVSLPSPPDGPG